MNLKALRDLVRFVAFLACAFACPGMMRGAPISIETVLVGDSGNSADTATGAGSLGFGAIGHDYKIGKYDVTNAQYAAFLNAVDPTGANTLALYNSNMASGNQGGITRTGSSYV